MKAHYFSMRLDDRSYVAPKALAATTGRTQAGRIGCLVRVEPENASRWTAVIEPVHLLHGLQPRHGREFHSYGFYRLPRLLLPDLARPGAFIALENADTIPSLTLGLQARFDPRLAEALKGDLGHSQMRQSRKAADK